ncbi:GntR family transcriptional regulator [Aquimarina sp. 2201CG5-10]|uniref:GntR family transcriptional regulator n=1 Tax=Aquimarina callyspongiae TaxID=3098150 RepID=UPI002AB3865A|nr:GntR family transcriptional regulator [Aquimarina sp. 2201CG5-10]MDY8138748.1 GntR family transcriptional regulator [Aquimarina sp. 2201CG5-10]
MGIIQVKNKIGIPKYKQIVISIEKAIEDGKLKKGDRLPSINGICKEFGLSRDTVLTSFNELKNRDIVYSVPGKGYYINSTITNYIKKIFLLFDELNAFKEKLYNSLIENLGDNIKVDIFFHHFNEVVFEKNIKDNIGDYSAYIVMPANLKNTKPILDLIPENQLYILDQSNEQLKDFSAIYQNFSKDIYLALKEATTLLEKYNKITLVHSISKQPIGMREGFDAFCEEIKIKYQTIERFELDYKISKKEVYVVTDDADMIRVIKKAKQERLIIGEDIGIISYNDTDLKEVVCNGITTISTDFEEMGTILADMVLHNKTVQIENRNSLIVRNSL